MKICRDCRQYPRPQPRDQRVASIRGISKVVKDSASSTPKRPGHGAHERFQLLHDRAAEERASQRQAHGDGMPVEDGTATVSDINRRRGERVTFDARESMDRLRHYAVSIL